MRTWVKSLPSSVVVHVCNPNSWEVEAGELGVQDHLQLHLNLKDGLVI